MLKCTGTCNFISFFWIVLWTTVGQALQRMNQSSKELYNFSVKNNVQQTKYFNKYSIYIYGTLLPDKRTLQWDTSSTWDSKSQPKKSKRQIQYNLIRNHPSIMTCFWQSKFFSIKFPSAAILSKLNEHNVFSSLNVSHYLILIATYTSRVDGCTRLVLHNSR